MMESLNLNSRRIPEEIFEKIVIAISVGIFGGSFGVSSEKLLKKSFEENFGLFDPLRKSLMISRDSFEDISGRMPLEGMLEGFLPEEFLVESVVKLLEELLIKLLIEFQEEFLVEFLV